MGEGGSFIQGDFRRPPNILHFLFQEGKRMPQGPGVEVGGHKG